MNVKFCGITRLEDALYARQLGAWAVGYIFYEKSARAVSKTRAAVISGKLGNDIQKVGVFVNESLDEIESAIDQAGLDMVQLHGEESPLFCAQVSKPVIKVFHPRSIGDLSFLQVYKGVHAVLVDAAVEGQYGGTGQKADWEFVRQIQKDLRPILSGGLTPGNVAQAVSETSPFAVDVASGVEISPGRKDHGKMKEFFSQATKASE